MKYDHKEADGDLLKEGWYEATITKAEDKVSQKGNAMMLLHVRIDGEHGAVFIKDYIVSSVSFHLSRLKRLCAAVGIDYEAGEVKPDQLEGQEMSVSVKIEEGKGDFDDKNTIKQYAKAGKTLENTGGLAPPNPEIDDDIPF